MISYSLLHWVLSVWGLAVLVAFIGICVFDLAGMIARRLTPRYPDNEEMIRQMYADPGAFDYGAVSEVIEHQRKGK
jgi:uncharacterized protein YneF (UPF0154 family)